MTKNSKEVENANNYGRNFKVNEKLAPKCSRIDSFMGDSFVLSSIKCVKL